MHCGETWFNECEIRDILEVKGYTHGTQAYQQERARCFEPIEGMEGCYREKAAVKSLQPINVAQERVTE
jgi:hypothetical protein